MGFGIMKPAMNEQERLRQVRTDVISVSCVATECHAHNCTVIKKDGTSRVARINCSINLDVR
jgi:hypothetical protein